MNRYRKFPRVVFTVLFTFLSIIHPAVAQHDHMASIALVELADATHTAEQSGDWSVSATWENDEIPTANARIVIPAGIEVTVNSKITEAFRTIRVDGTLRFADDTDTELKVDTIVTTHMSLLEIGTPTNPIDPDVTASLIIADANGGFETGDTASPDYDPKKIGQGLIAHGQVSFCGTGITPFTTLTGNVSAGATTLSLESVPSDWEVGDTIVIAGTQTDAGGDEVKTISAIGAGNITVATPLSFSHSTPGHTKSGLNLKIHVANTTRNVILKTATGNTGPTGTVQTTDDKGNTYTGDAYNGRGHVMLMTANVDIRNAGFYDLGRTNKLIPVDDSGPNPRSRYSIHFHQIGHSATANVTGCAVVSSPGWGYVNHSSAVNMTNNVAYDTAGAAFVTEAGDESGSFIGNLAIRNHGDGRKEDGRDDLEDWGHKGSGFWFQGAAGVIVQNNIATGSTGEAFAVYADPIGGVVNVAKQHLRIPSVYDSDVQVARAPMNLFDNNVAYGSDTAIGIFSNRTDDEPFQSEVDNFTAWAVNLGATSAYTSGLIYNDIILIGDLSLPHGVGHDSHHGSFNIEFHDAHIEGFVIGLQTPRADRDNAIVGGYYNNFVNLWLDPGRRFSTPAFMDLQGFELHISNPTFDQLSTAAQAYAATNLVDAADLTLWNGESGRFDDLVITSQQDIFSDMHIGAKPPNLNHTFIPMFVTIDIGDGHAYRLYIEDLQHPDTVVFPSSVFSGSMGRNSNIPTQIRDLTNSATALWTSNLDQLQTTNDKNQPASYQDIFLVNFGDRVNADTDWILAPGGRLLPSNYLTDTDFTASGSATPLQVNGSPLRLNNTVLEKITPADGDLTIDGLDANGNLDLGNVTVGEIVTISVEVTNNGGGPFDLTSVSLSGGGFMILSPDESFTQLSLWAGESQTFDISLIAVTNSPSFGTLSFNSSHSSFPTVSIGSNNTAPTPVADEFTIETMEPHLLNVLANDTDPDGHALTVSSVSTPQFGEVEINTGQTLTYTSLDPFWETDTFTYSVSDGFGGTASTTVTLSADGSGAYIEAAGMIAIEAEGFNSKTTGTGAAVTHQWELNSDAQLTTWWMEATPDNGVAIVSTTDGPLMDFELQIENPGPYYVWIRAQGSAYGRWFHVGANGTFLPNNGIGIRAAKDQWAWGHVAKDGPLILDVAEAGSQTLNIWMRQDGTLIDSIILSNDPDFTPTGPLSETSAQGL